MSGARWTIAAVAVALLACSAHADASHSAESPKKHRVFYHLNEGGIEKARAVLVNMQNHVDVQRRCDGLDRSSF